MPDDRDVPRPWRERCSCGPGASVVLAQRQWFPTEVSDPRPGQQAVPEICSLASMRRGCDWRTGLGLAASDRPKPPRRVPLLHRKHRFVPPRRLHRGSKIGRPFPDSRRSTHRTGAVGPACRSADVAPSRSTAPASAAAARGSAGTAARSARPSGPQAVFRSGKRLGLPPVNQVLSATAVCRRRVALAGWSCFVKAKTWGLRL